MVDALASHPGSTEQIGAAGHAHVVQAEGVAGAPGTTVRGDVGTGARFGVTHLPARACIARPGHCSGRADQPFGFRDAGAYTRSRGRAGASNGRVAGDTAIVPLTIDDERPVRRAR